MKNLRRIAAMFLVAGATLVGTMMAPGGAAAAGPTINCAIPLAVECQVSHPDGIKSVKVAVNFGGGIGVIDVVDEDYAGCPKNVEVSWDAIVPNYAFEVETCKGLKLTNGARPTHGGINDSGIKALAVLNQQSGPALHR